MLYKVHFKTICYRNQFTSWRHNFHCTTQALQRSWAHVAHAIRIERNSTKCNCLAMKLSRTVVSTVDEINANRQFWPEAIAVWIVFRDQLWMWQFRKMKHFSMSCAYVVEITVCSKIFDCRKQLERFFSPSNHCASNRSANKFFLK